MIKFILYMVIVYFALWFIVEIDEKHKSKGFKNEKRQ